MDVYKETLMKALMPDGIPETWFESDEFSPYIQHLASCGLEKLSSETDALKEEQTAVLEQTKELAYKEYLTFIHAADCSKSLHTQLGSLEQQLSRTSDGVSALHGTLNHFVDTSRCLLVARQTNTATLARHSQLLELLELSQLLDTCVRSGYHDEALELIAYVRRLEKRHGHIPVIKGIVSEVQGSSQQMLSQLLTQLRSDISLPQCLKVVGLIRTLDVFPECQLRVKFLHAREAWLQAALAAIPRTDAYQHVSRSMECARVHLFDIATQYRAVFSHDEARYGPPGDRDASLPAVLHSWILHQVQQVLALLRRALDRGVSGSNLEALLSQCLFFGQSLSRIGADFRGVLPQLFQAAAGKQLRRAVTAANHKFDESLSAFSLTDTVPALRQPPPLQGGAGGVRPPLTLLEFPPLGHYLNSLVTAFNTLRLCCFTALLPHLLHLLSVSLGKVVQSLLDLHSVECSGFTGTETSSFSRLCGAVSGSLVPHVNACLRALYPLAVMAEYTGTSVHVLQKMNFGQLNGDVICAPLKDYLLPAPHPLRDNDRGQTQELRGSGDVAEQQTARETVLQHGGTEQHLPVTEQHLPVTEQHLPVTEQHLPLTEQHLFVTKQHIPLTEQHIPLTEEHLPVTEQHLPLTEEHLAVTERGVPGTKYHLPETSTNNTKNDQSYEEAKELSGTQQWEAESLARVLFEREQQPHTADAATPLSLTEAELPRAATATHAATATSATTVGDCVPNTPVVLEAVTIPAGLEDGLTEVNLDE